MAVTDFYRLLPAATASEQADGNIPVRFELTLMTVLVEMKQAYGTDAAAAWASQRNVPLPGPFPEHIIEG